MGSQLETRIDGGLDVGRSGDISDDVQTPDVALPVLIEDRVTIAHVGVGALADEDRLEGLGHAHFSTFVLAAPVDLSEQGGLVAAPRTDLAWTAISITESSTTVHKDCPETRRHAEQRYQRTEALPETRRKTRIGQLRSNDRPVHGQDQRGFRARHAPLVDQHADAERVPPRGQRIHFDEDVVAQIPALTVRAHRLYEF